MKSAGAEIGLSFALPIKVTVLVLRGLIRYTNLAVKVRSSSVAVPPANLPTTKEPDGIVVILTVSSGKIFHIYSTSLVMKYSSPKLTVEIIDGVGAGDGVGVGGFGDTGNTGSANTNENRDSVRIVDRRNRIIFLW